MAFIGTKGHTALTYIPHLLLFCAFGIMLGGIAAQQVRASSAAALPSPLTLAALLHCRTNAAPPPTPKSSGSTTTWPPPREWNEPWIGLPPSSRSPPPFLPARCDRLYSFDWWITFYHLFLWAVLLPLILGRQLHKARNAVTGLAIVGALLAMHMTNTW